MSKSKILNYAGVIKVYVKCWFFIAFISIACLFLLFSLQYKEATILFWLSAFMYYIAFCLLKKRKMFKEKKDG